MNPGSMHQFITCAVSIFLFFFTDFASGQAKSAWTRLTKPTPDALHDIAITKTNIYCYTYGTGKIYQSRNNGLSWQQVFSGDSTYYEQMGFLESSGWVVGDYGRLLHSKDGGTTWNEGHIRLPHCDRLLLYGLVAVNEKKIMVSGGCLNKGRLEPKILLTNDGGNTWSEQADAPQFYYNLEMLPDGRIIATGDNTIAINDGGDWKISYQDSTKMMGQIRDVDFGDRGFIVATGFNGAVAISFDGGLHWATSKVTNNRIRSVAIMRNVIYVAGDNNKELGSLWVSHDHGKTFSVVNGFPDIHRLRKKGRALWAVGKEGFVAVLRRR